MMLRSARDVLDLLGASPSALAALAAAREVDLPDWWIASGFVRTPVWNASFGHSPDPVEPDIDLVFFDPVDTSREREQAAAQRLSALRPGRWEPRNQARMHLKNGFAPFASTRDGMDHWVETVAPIGVRLGAGGRLRLTSCYGIDDLLGGVLRPTPYFAGVRRPVFEARVAAKGWLERWPGVRLAPAGPPGA